jgi:hypothetical protein
MTTPASFSTEMHSEVSESSQSELSETLNTSALNTNTQAAVADLPSAGIAPEVVQIEGKTYLLIDRLANQLPNARESLVVARSYSALSVAASRRTLSRRPNA